MAEVATAHLLLQDNIRDTSTEKRQKREEKEGANNRKTGPTPLPRELERDARGPEKQCGQGWVARHSGLLALSPSGCGTGSCLLRHSGPFTTLGLVWPSGLLTTLGLTGHPGPLTRWVSDRMDHPSDRDVSLGTLPMCRLNGLPDFSGWSIPVSASLKKHHQSIKLLALRNFNRCVSPGLLVLSVETNWEIDNHVNVLYLTNLQAVMPPVFTSITSAGNADTSVDSTTCAVKTAELTGVLVRRRLAVELTSAVPANSATTDFGTNDCWDLPLGTPVLRSVSQCFMASRP